LALTTTRAEADAARVAVGSARINADALQELLSGPRRVCEGSNRVATDDTISARARASLRHSLAMLSAWRESAIAWARDFNSRWVGFRVPDAIARRVASSSVAFLATAKESCAMARANWMGERASGLRSFFPSFFPSFLIGDVSTGDRDAVAVSVVMGQYPLQVTRLDFPHTGENRPHH